MFAQGGGERIVQIESFNQPYQLNEPTSFKIGSFGKCLHFRYLFLLQRTQTTFKWKIRPVALYGRKTQYNQACEVIKISSQT